ncbi:MAG: hypothetical protein U0W40_11405 [Acidimicrobiia bacterium]
MTIEPAGVLNGEAWREFCARAAAAGDRILGDEFPGRGPDGARDRAEGVRHVANQLACWLTFAVGFTDVEHPAFFRSADPVYRWGGPNVDQVARRSAIAGDGVYRVSGTMGSCEDFALQVKVGATQSGGADIALEVFASQLGLGPGDDFDLVFGGQEADAGDARWFPLDADASFVHVRDYYFDWQATEPATFVIERLDTQGAPARPVDAERVARMLETAVHEVEHSVVFWQQYQARMMDQRGGPNVFNEPRPEGRGVQDIMYAHAFVNLPHDEAMVLTLDAADAPMWDVGTYNRAWYEPLDYANGVTSLNHRQVFGAADGTVRVVVAGTDPGVANWLSTEGRDEVLCTIRWIRPPGQPTLRYERVALADLDAHLAPGTPRVDAAARRAEVAARAAHVAWRFRT